MKTCYADGMDEYLTVEEAAAALGMSARAIRNRIERGDMQAQRLGARLWAIPRAEVERWHERGRLHPGPKPKKQAGAPRQNGEGSELA